METPEILVKVAPVVGVILVWAIVSISHQTLRRRQSAQTEVQLALLNKFSSSEEMVRFLATDEGRRLMDQLAATPFSRDPRQRVVGLTIGGIVSACLSIGFLVLANVDGRQDYLERAVIFGAAGIGLLAGALVSYRISKNFDPSSTEK